MKLADRFWPKADIRMLSIPGSVRPGYLLLLQGLTPSVTEAALDLPETLAAGDGGCRDQTDAILCGNRVVAW